MISEFLLGGLSASLRSADFPKWRPYSKLFNEPLRVSLAFFTLIHSIKQACFAASHKKSSDFRRSFVNWLGLEPRAHTLKVYCSTN